MRQILFALMFVFGLTACDNKETPAVDAKPTIKIGAILPLSGNIAEMGDASRKAMIMALE